MIVFIILFVFFLWLLGISYFAWKIQAHYSELIEGVNGKTLQAVMDGVLHDIKGAKGQIEELEKKTRMLDQDSQLHIQRIGLLRFNPFKDTGGDQSFVLALLNQHNTGIVISGLYSRAGTRWYAKKVTQGKGVEHELSDEEKKAIEVAHTK